MAWDLHPRYANPKKEFECDSLSKGTSSVARNIKGRSMNSLYQALGIAWKKNIGKKAAALAFFLSVSLESITECIKNKCFLSKRGNLNQRFLIFSIALLKM
ncbi:hypothetical protein SCA6_009551 [Theobroma cacao]